MSYSAQNMLQSLVTAFQSIIEGTANLNLFDLVPNLLRATSLIFWGRFTINDRRTSYCYCAQPMEAEDIHLKKVSTLSHTLFPYHSHVNKKCENFIMGAS